MANIKFKYKCHLKMSNVNAEIEAKYEQARTTLQQVQKEAEEKLKAEEEEYKKRAEELQDAFVKEVGAEVAEAATTTAIAKYFVLILFYNYYLYKI